MKFSLFLHVERYDDRTPITQQLNEMTELVQIAERGGFEAAWVGEHHGMGFTIAPNPFVNLAYLAAKTERIRLGTGTVIAPFWHPIKLAGEAGLVDALSGGRLDLGIARGAYTFEYERLFPGLDAMDAGARMRDMVPLLQRLFKGNASADTPYWQFPETTPLPRPVQTPWPPMWIAARDPHSHDFAVGHGCNVQVTPLAAGDAEVASLMERFNAACANHPEVPRPEIMLLMHTFVGADDAEVDQACKDLQAFYCNFMKWVKKERPIEQGLMESLRQEDLDAFPQFAPEKLRESLVVGKPEAVIARLKSYEAQGYDQYSFWIDNCMSFETKKRTLENFIAHVVPAFQ